MFDENETEGWSEEIWGFRKYYSSNGIHNPGMSSPAGMWSRSGDIVPTPLQVNGCFFLTRASVPLGSSLYTSQTPPASCPTPKPSLFSILSASERLGAMAPFCYCFFCKSLLTPHRSLHLSHTLCTSFCPPVTLTILSHGILNLTSLPFMLSPLPPPAYSQ